MKQKNPGRLVRKAILALQRCRGAAVFHFTNAEMEKACLERMAEGRVEPTQRNVKKWAQLVYDEFHERQQVRLGEWEGEIRSLLGPAVGTRTIKGHDVNDLTQLCLVKFWKARKDHPDDFEKPWYRRKIVLHTVMDVIRSSKDECRNGACLDDVPGRAEDPAAAAMEKETREAIARRYRECLDFLRDEGQGRFVRVLEALVWAETEAGGDAGKAAEHAGMSRGSYHSTLCRAKAFLRDHFRGRYTDAHDQAIDLAILAAFVAAAQTTRARETGVAGLTTTWHAVSAVVTSVGSFLASVLEPWAMGVLYSPPPKVTAGIILLAGCAAVNSDVQAPEARHSERPVAPFVRGPSSPRPRGKAAAVVPAVVGLPTPTLQGGRPTRAKPGRGGQVQSEVTPAPYAPGPGSSVASATSFVASPGAEPPGEVPLVKACTPTAQHLPHYRCSLAR